MNDLELQPTISYLQTKFSEYYDQSDLSYPERFTRREWGFMFLGESYMQRHLHFKTGEEIKTFLAGKSAGTSPIPGERFRVPAHVYYSSAYYSDPGLQPMPKKVEGWLGADLIFDVDDEHIRGIEGLTYAERLTKVKNIVNNKLLNDFLLNDFGFDKKYVSVVFSGSRGYHIHIKDPKILELGSMERREIVDYIIGLGLDYSSIFPEETFELTNFGEGRFAKKTRIAMPVKDSNAWKSRMRRGVLELVNELEELEPNLAIQRLLEISKDITFRSEGGRPKKRFGRKTATEIYTNLFEGNPGKRGADRIRTENVLEIFSKDSYRNKFIELVKARTAVEMAGETDEPVTTDVKRLIRMPSSIHGKTGLKVMPLSLEELENFEPLEDAVVFGETPVKINIGEQADYTLKGQQFSVKPGLIELPEYAAIFLMCQRKAVIASE